ncbi:UNVERIFIED_CONTAM: hypothetical protein FKN15_037552 [Acipenser sinensis]
MPLGSDKPDSSEEDKLSDSSESRNRADSTERALGIRQRTPSPHQGNAPQSSPRFVSVEELMETAKGVSNMALAHEIVVSGGFQLKPSDPAEGRNILASEKVYPYAVQPVYKSVFSASCLKLVIQRNMPLGSDKPGSSEEDKLSDSSESRNRDDTSEQALGIRQRTPSPHRGNTPQSSPRFVSVEELMETAKGVSNMALAHEIVVSGGFQLKPSDPAEGRLRNQINEVVDLDLIKQEAENGALDINKVVEFIISMMGTLCAPARDEEIRKLRDITAIVPLFKAIFSVLDLMKIDMANFAVSSIRPHLMQQSVEYERTKFQEFIEKQHNSRIQTFLMSYLDSSHHKSSPVVPGGLVPIQKELEEIAVKFSRLVNYNKMVFAPHYEKILKGILSKDESHSMGKSAGQG